MVDEGRVARLLRGVAERTGRLTAAAATPTAERSDVWLDAVKHQFVAGVSAWLLRHV